MTCETCRGALDGAFVRAIDAAAPRDAHELTEMMWRYDCMICRAMIIVLFLFIMASVMARLMSGLADG